LPIAVVILAVSFPLNGCTRTQQAVYAKPPLRSSWVNPQSRRRPSKTDQSKVGKTTSADQQASPTNQGEFGETSSTSQHGTRIDQGDLGRTPPPPPPQRKPEQPRTNASIPAVEQEREAKFKAAEAKAKREGVGSLIRENIDGLTPEQLKEIRGY